LLLLLAAIYRVYVLSGKDGGFWQINDFSLFLCFLFFILTPLGVACAACLACSGEAGSGVKGDHREGLREEGRMWNDWMNVVSRSERRITAATVVRRLVPLPEREASSMTNEVTT